MKYEFHRNGKIVFEIGTYMGNSIYFQIVLEISFILYWEGK